MIPSEKNEIKINNVGQLSYTDRNTYLTKIVLILCM